MNFRRFSIDDVRNHDPLPIDASGVTKRNEGLLLVAWTCDVMPTIRIFEGELVGEEQKYQH